MDQIQFEKIKELYTRAISTFYTQVGLVILIFAYYQYIHPLHLGYVFCFLLLFLYTITRYFVFKKNLARLLTKKISSKQAHNFFTMLIIPYGSIWAIFMSVPLMFFNINELQANFYVFMMASLIASGLGALAISKRDFWFFIAPQLISLFVYFIYRSNDGFLTLMEITVLCSFMLYLFNQQRSSHNLWKNFISQQINQQYLLKCFPGLVSLLKNKNSVFANQSFNEVFEADINLKQKIQLELDSLDNSQYVEKTFETDLHTTQGDLQTHLFILSKLPANQAIIVGLNIQEQKDKEAQIQEQKALLDQSSKMAALGEMSGGIAHEINNPLAVISLSSQKLKKDLSQIQISDSNLQNKIDSSMLKIESMVSRISKIIKALRAFARDGSSDPVENVSIGHIFDDTLIFCETKFANSEIQIIKNYNPEIEIKCRSTEISQVILNLLNNAYDAIVSSTT